MNRTVYVVCGRPIVDSHNVRRDKLSTVEVVSWDWNVTPVPCCRAVLLVLPMSALIFAEVTHIWASRRIWLCLIKYCPLTSFRGRFLIKRDGSDGMPLKGRGKPFNKEFTDLFPSSHYSQGDLPFKVQWFNVYKIYVLPTHCIYVFCVDLRTNSDYFAIQH